MSKTYLLVKPSEFWKYDSVDINGEYKHVTNEDFNIDNRFNKLRLEIMNRKNVQLEKKES